MGLSRRGRGPQDPCYHPPPVDPPLLSHPHCHPFFLVGSYPPPFTIIPPPSGLSPDVTPLLPLSPLGSPLCHLPLSVGIPRCHPFTLAGILVTLPPYCHPFSHGPLLHCHPFYWQTVSLHCHLWVASCCYPPTPLSPFFLGGQSLFSLHPSVVSSPAVMAPLSPPFLVQRAPLWPREVLSALAPGGPSFPTALCSGGHAPSLAQVAIGCPGHVRPAPPPWELVSQQGSSIARVLCSVRALPKSARESRRCRKPPWSLESDPRHRVGVPICVDPS